MKKVYISQPMRGLTDEIIEKRRSEYASVCKRIIGEEVEIVDSFFKGVKASPIVMLGDAIKKMDEADYVFFSADWREARGCRCEHQIACAYHKNTITALPDGQYQMFISLVKE